ncbi:MAG: SRPBCC family protein [Aquabacterium sp.]
MKWLKGVLFALIGLVAFLWLGGYALSSKFTVARSVEIAAPPAKAYALVANPRHWKNWTVWNQRDPSMKITYFGPESGGTGAGWSWASKSEGDGKMTFTAAEADKRVAYDLYFPDFGTTSAGDLRFEAAGQGSKVTWTMNGDMGTNPLFRWIALFSDRMVGGDFEAGLANLKALAEKP